LSKKHQSGLILVLLVFFIIAALFGWWWQGNVRHGKYQDLLTAFYVMGVVKVNFYQPVSVVKLMKAYWKTGSISGMLKSLQDPYTRFLNKEEYDELRKETKGTFGGIGVHLIPKEGELLVSSVVKGSPGQKAGIQQGDRIVSVNKASVKSLSVDVAIAKIRGTAGTSVLLGISRGEGANRRELEIRLTRENILIPTVEMQFKTDPVLGKYAHLKIYQFADTTPGDLDKQLRELDKTPDCKGLILDLRANPGGSLDAAHKVVSEFIKPGAPVIHIVRRGYPAETLKAETYHHKQLPMVVLVDGWSASASEIVAGALKDQNRALIVGAPTYGKDLIQEVKELPGDTGMTITIASYLTSGKVNIHKKGVSPNLVVEIPGAMDQLLKEGNLKPFFRMQQLQEDAAVKVLRNKVITPEEKLAG
jgi:carboxyl-terminal processing protease